MSREYFAGVGGQEHSQSLGPFATREEAITAGEVKWRKVSFQTYYGRGYFDIRSHGEAPRLFPTKAQRKQIT